jgi:hypothetical protein
VSTAPSRRWPQPQKDSDADPMRGRPTPLASHRHRAERLHPGCRVLIFRRGHGTVAAEDSRAPTGLRHIPCHIPTHAPLDAQG